MLDKLNYKMNYKPYYFLTTGRTESSINVMYTLRKSKLTWIKTEAGLEPRKTSYHVQNLSTNYITAIEKARLIAGDVKLKITPKQDTRSWGEGSLDSNQDSKYLSKLAIEDIKKSFLSQYQELPYIQVVPNTEDRISLEGKIVSTKFVDNDFGGSTKMLFEDDRGFRLWGALPKILNDNESDLNNMSIRFIAQVKVSDNDKCFGFYKRPTKIEVI
jgi:hypothetical protein